MSARVFNPVAMSEFKRMISLNVNGSDSSGQIDGSSVKRIRKNLFGPVDHDYNLAFVERELAAANVRDSEKWGFDFIREKPVKSTRFVWERVMPEKDNIPEPYALRRLPYLQTHADNTTCSVKRKSPPIKSVSQLQKPTRRSKGAVKQSHITEYLKCRKRNSPKAIGAGETVQKLRSHHTLAASPKKRNVSSSSS